MKLLRGRAFFYILWFIAFFCPSLFLVIGHFYHFCVCCSSEGYFSLYACANGVYTVLNITWYRSTQNSFSPYTVHKEFVDLVWIKTRMNYQLFHDSFSLSDWSISRHKNEQCFFQATLDDHIKFFTILYEDKLSIQFGYYNPRILVSHEIHMMWLKII